ncbi:hypothetical protein ABT263_12895 [Kitasatospora sp. NPDC001603]|uniref:hypothetical protein n=1 Tax=Kitasatospora sp. NPDC001603 TaxID=3154388 RepID=UPI00332F5AE8
MSKARVVAVAVAAGSVPVLLGLLAGWPVWLWTVAAVVLALVVGLSIGRPGAPVREESRGPYVPPAPPAQPPVVELPYQEDRVEGVALPSGLPDYDFLFSATVWWRPVHNATGLVHVNPGGLAVEAVLARARAVTEREHPSRLDLVRHRLEGTLGTQCPDSSGLVVAMGGRVGLGLPDADRERLDKLSEVRKAEEVWEHERRYERSKRAYLGDDVLKSPGSAVVWWLARHDEEVGEAVGMIGPLAQLSAAANDRPVDELYEHLVTRPLRQPVPFLDAVAPGVVSALHHPDVDEGAAAATETATATMAGAQDPGRRGPAVVGPLNDLMDDVDVDGEEGERTVYALRVAGITEAMGNSEAAALIRASLAEPPEEGPGSSAFVPGPVRPGGPGVEASAPGGASVPDGAYASREAEEPDESVPAPWEVYMQDSVNGSGA